jgi:hypothetical protein
VRLLDTLGQTALSRRLCNQAQERFTDDPMVAGIIARHLGAA